MIGPSNNVQILVRKWQSYEEDTKNCNVISWQTVWSNENLTVIQNKNYFQGTEITLLSDVLCSIITQR